MLTKTSLTALRALLLLERTSPAAPFAPRAIAGALGESPTYMAKISARLVRAGLLRAQRGAGGGVTLALPARRVTLLAVVEACQGSLRPDYCREWPRPETACAFHQAADELHRAIVRTLSRWTLAHLLEKPEPSASFKGPDGCLMRVPTAPRPARGNGRRRAKRAKGRA